MRSENAGAQTLPSWPVSGLDERARPGIPQECRPVVAARRDERPVSAERAAHDRRRVFALEGELRAVGKVHQRALAVPWRVGEQERAVVERHRAAVPRIAHWRGGRDRCYGAWRGVAGLPRGDRDLAWLVHATSAFAAGISGAITSPSSNIKRSCSTIPVGMRSVRCTCNVAAS